MSSASKSIALNYRNIYILPTRRGLGFVMLIALLLLIAFIYNNNLVYLLSFLLASLFFITILHTVKSLQGLVISKGHSEPVFAGEFASSKITLNNPTPIERYSVQVGINKHMALQTIDIPAQQKQRLNLAYKTDKRGWLVMANPVISSCYPFGLFRAWQRLNLDSKVLVYPMPSMQDCPLPENNQGQEQLGNAQKGQDDFYGLQSYQTGDSIRHIHWRAFAKGQGLFTRQYSGAQSAEIWLDYEQAMAASQEERLSIMCRWVLDADEAGMTYGFRLAGLILEPNQGEAHSKKCLEALALF
ncbi:MAG: DUF58 domain-containing protein [Methylococcaceae bacterium]|nr:DUF58 domain-containing protein [Methylococcaceae bacterium]